MECPHKTTQRVCVCVCVFMIYEGTNLYNDIGITLVLQHKCGL